MEESWAAVPGFTFYEVSSAGRVRSNKRRDPKIITPVENSGGYLQVQFWMHSKPSSRMLARLVWESFVGEIDAGLFLSYKDGDPLNCALNNLILRSKSDIAKGKRKLNYEPQIVEAVLDMFYNKHMTLNAIRRDLEISGHALRSILSKHGTHENIEP